MDFATAEAILSILERVKRIDRQNRKILVRQDDILAELSLLEVHMTTQAEAIAGLGAKVDGLTALTTDILADFNAFKDAMTTERENLTAAGQAALDEANAKTDAAQAKLTELDVAVGDADGSDTATPPPVEPPVV
jgi:hypothetical protein